MENTDMACVNETPTKTQIQRLLCISRSELRCSSLSVRCTEASSILAKPVFHPNSSKPEFRQLDHTCTGCRDTLWIMWPCTALRCLSNTISICYHWAVACLGLPGPGHQNHSSQHRKLFWIVLGQKHLKGKCVTWNTGMRWPGLPAPNLDRQRQGSMNSIALFVLLVSQFSDWIKVYKIVNIPK